MSELTREGIYDLLSLSAEERALADDRADFEAAARRTAIVQMEQLKAHLRELRDRIVDELLGR